MENFDENEPACENLNYATVSPVGQVKPPSPLPDKRRSQTVQEIEKLKKGREERRAKIEQQRNEMAMFNATLEPGHHNWEFARMIHDYRSKVDVHRMWAADMVKFLLL